MVMSMLAPVRRRLPPRNTALHDLAVLALRACSNRLADRPVVDVADAEVGRVDTDDLARGGAGDFRA